MSQDASIIARLGLDTAGFATGLRQAGDLRKGFSNQTTAGNESVLESEKKVERQLGSLLEKLTQVKSGGGAAATAIEALAESIQLSLGTAIGAAAVIGFVRMVAKIGEEAKEAKGKLDELLRAGSQSADFSALSAMQSRLTELQSTFAELTKDKGMWGNIKEILAESSFFGGEGGSFDEMAARKGEKMLDVLREIDEARGKIAEKAANTTRIMEMEAAGQETAAKLEKLRLDYAEKTGAAIAAQNIGLVEQLKQQQSIAEASLLNADAAKQAAEVAELRDFERQQSAAFFAEQEKAVADLREFERQQYSQFLGWKEEQEKEAADAEKERIDDIRDHERKQYAEFRAHKAELDRKDAEAQKKAAEEMVAARQQAEDDFVGEKMAGPDAARDAKREARREASLRRQFERMEELDARGGKAAADVNAEKLADALKPRGRTKDGDLLDPNRKGPLDRREPLDRKDAKDQADKQHEKAVETALQKIERNTRKLGVNL